MLITEHLPYETDKSSIKLTIAATEIFCNISVILQYPQENTSVEVFF